MKHLVVVGLGYVGLPLVAEAVRAGLSVTGFDITPAVVEGLNAGCSHVDDLSDETIADLLQLGFRATGDVACVEDADAVVICVPTPLSAEGGPDLAAVQGACREIGPYLRPGTLVVLESTTYPGTTAELVRPLLEELSGLGPDQLHVAYSPERIDPGNPSYGLKNTPKVVGADDPVAAQRAHDFYAQVVDVVVVSGGTREAESAKLLENTYRHVNIALVNEMARFFHELDIDFWEVIRLASTKPFGFQPFTPGPGVGGHCIPIDPNYLSHRVRTQLGYGFRFVELAQEINSSMPSYVVARVAELLNEQSQALRGSTVLLLGVTYKPDIADQRESPAIDVARRLVRAGAVVRYHDPYVENWEVAGTERADADLLAAVADADVSVLLQNHADYDLDAIEAAARCLFDTRGRTTGTRAHRL
jgi:UDP-N-acetyl-D-glucosamine dehydrogenase